MMTALAASIVLKGTRLTLLGNRFKTFKLLIGVWVHLMGGWSLVNFDDQKNIIRIFNPISGNKSMELPHIPSTTSALLGSPPFYHVAKAVLSSNPSRNNFSVAIIYGIQPSRLAFYNCGDEEWTDLNGEHQEYCDIIFHNGQLFALAGNGSVEVWDFRKLPLKRTINLRPTSSKDFDLEYYTSDRDKFSTNIYLVESSNEILSVVRCIGNFVNEEGKAIHEKDVLDELYSPCPYKTLQFYVFKLNFAANKWEKVDCLPNRALFLGGSQSISLSTTDVSGCEENSIYFTDDRWDEIELLGDIDCYGGHDMGVYNLEDKVVKRFCLSDNGRIDPPPFWIVPNW